MKKIITKYYKIDPKVPSLPPIQEAAEIIRRGGTVAFPTETVYGLGANALDPQAVSKIFRAKGRPGDNPLIVHIANPKDVAPLVSSIPQEAEKLMKLFWPGPLTLIFPKSSIVPSAVTAGIETVAIRIPAHPVALTLIKAARVPIAAPSANLSGKPSPTTGLHVLKDLADKIDMVLDGGKANVGVESTVLDLTVDPPLILRPGGITLEQLRKVLAKVELDPALSNESILEGIVPRAPGMKYTHYAPKAEVYLVEGNPGQVAKRMQKLVQEYQEQGRRVGILGTEELLFRCKDLTSPDHWEILGSEEDLAEVAARLFNALRNCDRYHLDIVFGQTFPEVGMGRAIMNRLKKSAGHRVIYANEE
ncbi:L-threonylcarbamoyladenylate synthase [Bacillota bacterium LX-D]|nr:L-threonylcarbamoyladenylate synthase [Bacillota bacterium LX-D]